MTAYSPHRATDRNGRALAQRCDREGIATISPSQLSANSQPSRQHTQGDGHLTASVTSQRRLDSITETREQSTQQNVGRSVSICVSVCPSVRQSVSQSVRPRVRPSVYPSVHLSVCGMLQHHHVEEDLAATTFRSFRSQYRFVRAFGIHPNVTAYTTSPGGRSFIGATLSSVCSCLCLGCTRNKAKGEFV